MANPKTAMGVLIFFPKPGSTAMNKRLTRSTGTKAHNQTDHLIYQILESKYGLMAALEDLTGLCKAMTVGQSLENANEILAQAAIALKRAEEVAGHVPVTTAKADELRGPSEKQLLLFSAV